MPVRVFYNIIISSYLFVIYYFCWWRCRYFFTARVPVVRKTVPAAPVSWRRPVQLS